MFADMLRQLEALEADALWAREYEEFVRAVSFAGPGEAIDFAHALAACTRLIAVAYEGTLTRRRRPPSRSGKCGESWLADREPTDDG
jgi:hypothetical protein